MFFTFLNEKAISLILKYGIMEKLVMPIAVKFAFGVRWDFKRVTLPVSNVQNNYIISYLTPITMQHIFGSELLHFANCVS